MGSNHNNNDDGDGHVLRRLKTAVVLCLCFFFVEVAGGLISGSLAILSDAAHLFADLASFAVAIAAAYLSKLPPSSVCTYGYKRTEALAALFSMSCLLVMSVFLAGEAVRRMYLIKFDWENYEHVDGKFMSLVAAIGVIVNITLAFVLGEHHVHLPGDDHDHSHEHAHGHDHHNDDDDDHHHDHHNHNHHDDDDDDDDDKHHDHEHGHLHGPKKHKSATTNGHSHDEHGHSNHESDANHDSDDHSHDHDHEHEHSDHEHNDHHDHEHEHEHSDHHDHDEEHAHEGTKLLGGNNDIEKGHHHNHDDDDEHHDHHHHLDHFDSSSDDNNSSNTGSNNNDKFHKERNINLHAAYLHVLGDLTQSVAVLIAGCLIWYNSQWQIADPICTILFCFIVAYSTVGVIKSSVQVLLNNVPPNVELNKLYDAISAVHGISNVHDLHVWSISHGAPAVSLHANCSTKVAIPKALSDVNKVCEQFNIRHTTIQLQPSDHIHESCITCSDDDDSNNMNHGHNVYSSTTSSTNNGNGGNGNGGGRNSVHCSSFYSQGSQ